jgi:NADPH2:quinone reductase
MKSALPSSMKAVFQENKGSELVIKEVPVPEPDEGEVLVKMQYAPINPSDLSQLRGTLTPLPVYPFIPGIEGSGIVVAAGKGLIPSIRSGKRVACSPKGKGGTWAEYLVTDATKCIPLPNGISMENGSMLIVNPMTALALIDIALKGKHKSIVNNAAASSLGYMMIELCKKYKLNLINIVRSNKQADLLKQLGATNILISTDQDFKTNFRDLTEQFNTTLLLDAVGSEQTNTFISESPKGSRIILYANLSNSTFSADSRDILQHGKTIEGFSLPLWTADKSLIQLLRHMARVKSFIEKESNVQIRSQYGISEVNKALEEYRLSMSGGKVLLKL